MFTAGFLALLESFLDLSFLFVLMLLDLERDLDNDFVFADFIDLSLMELLLSVTFLPFDDFFRDLFVMVLCYFRLSVVF